MLFNPTKALLNTSNWKVLKTVIIVLTNRTTKTTNRKNAVMSKVLKNRKFFSVVSIFSCVFG
jgi:hypothetical protein